MCLGYTTNDYYQENKINTYYFVTKTVQDFSVIIVVETFD